MDTCIESPKRHFLAWFRVVWVIMSPSRTSDLTCTFLQENKTIYFISHIPPSADFHRIADVINYDNFLVISSGVLILRGLKFAISLFKEMSLLIVLPLPRSLCYPVSTAMGKPLPLSSYPVVLHFYSGLGVEWLLGRLWRENGTRTK